MKCCTQAKLALPRGGRPNCQRASSSLRNQSESLKGGLARTKSARRSGWRSRRKVSACSSPRSASMPRMGKVHHGEAARGGVALLTVDADVAELAAVGFDELFRLHEHAAGTAAGIVNATFVRSEHLDEKTYDSLRSVELAAFLAFGAGELAE